MMTKAPVDTPLPCGHSHPAAEHHGSHGYAENSEQYVARLRRIEGQVRGLQRMVESDRYCIDILTQISAVNSALQSVAIGLLREHLSHCVADAVADPAADGPAKVEEAMAAIARLLKS